MSLPSSVCLALPLLVMLAFLNFGIGCVSANPQTVKEVQQWKRDAEKGDTKAQYNLGVAYALGKGVKKNPVESEKWFLKSVEQGDGKDADAQCVLGLCYLKGMGVKEDDAEAVKLFRKAADHGYTEAQYRLGTCYMEGKGVVRDVEIAYEWFLLAKSGGNEDASSLVKMLEKSLSPTQIQTALARMKQGKLISPSS